MKSDLYLHSSFFFSKNNSFSSIWGRLYRLVLWVQQWLASWYRWGFFGTAAVSVSRWERSLERSSSRLPPNSLFSEIVDIRIEFEYCVYQCHCHGRPARTPDKFDNLYKCLNPKFPKTTRFCPDKIFEILSEIAPDLPADRFNLSEYGSNPDDSMRHFWLIYPLCIIIVMWKFGSIQ